MTTAVLCAVAYLPAASAQSRPYDLEPQPLASALNEFAQQAGVQLIYFTDIVQEATSPRLQGMFTVSEALTLLLKGSGLSFTVASESAVFIEAGPKRQPAAVAPRSPVRAERIVPPAGNEIPPVGELEVVTVTARRREEDLMEVPFSINLLAGSEVEDKNIQNLLAADGHFANVSIRTDPFSGAAGRQLGMRGIPGVVLYQDGVPVTFGALPPTLDLERVEVLRGPQGTLFGRNSVGGAIQIVTRKPSSTFFTSAELALGSLGRTDLTGNVNVPISEKAVVAVTGATLNREGFVASTKSGWQFGSQEDRMLRMDWLWQPFDGIEARAQYAHMTNRSSGHAYVNFRLQAVCPGDAVPAGYRNGVGEQVFFAPNAYCILNRLDLDPTLPGVQAYSPEFHSYGLLEQYRNTIATRDAEWWQQIEDAKLDVSIQLSERASARAIAARRWGTENSMEDLDGTGLLIFQNNLNEFQEQLDMRTGELQFVYEAPRLSGITGFYWEHVPGAFNKRMSWLHNELTIPEIRAAAETAYPGSTDFRVRPESAPFNTAEVFRISRTSSEQWAAFSEWTYAVTPSLKLTGGIRYTQQRDRRTRYLPGAAGASLMPPIRCCDLEDGADYLAPAGPVEIIPLPTYEQWTPRLSIQYQWPRLMTYASYAKGSTAGGIDAASPPGRPRTVFRPQVVRNYEAGARALSASGNASLHIAAFYNDFHDVQVVEETFPGTLTTGNAEARLYGLELQGGWSAADKWALSYGLGYLNAHYTDTGTTSNIVASTPFAYAPEFNVAIGVERRWNIADAHRLVLRGDYTWQAETVTSADPLTAATVPSRALLGARIEFTPRQGRWHVALSGTNLTNQFYFTNGFLLPADQSFAGTMGRPREWAISVGIRVD